MLSFILPLVLTCAQSYEMPCNYVTIRLENECGAECIILINGELVKCNEELEVPVYLGKIEIYVWIRDENGLRFEHAEINVDDYNICFELTIFVKQPVNFY